jgi:hypothetical protein
MRLRRAPMGLISVPSTKTTVVEVFRPRPKFNKQFQYIKSYSPNQRSHELRRIPALRDRYRASWPGGSAQPHPYNPRKQRKNPAAAGSGERFREVK